MDRTGSCDDEAWHVRWEIPTKDVPKVLRYAKLFGFTKIKPLLQAWESGTLPGQVADNGSEDSNLLPKGAKVAISGLPPRETKVLAGVAGNWSQTVNELLSEAVNGHVRALLALCLLHPETGEVLHAEFADEYRTRVDVEKGRPVSTRGY